MLGTVLGTRMLVAGTFVDNGAPFSLQATYYHCLVVPYTFDKVAGCLQLVLGRVLGTFVTRSNNYLGLGSSLYIHQVLLAGSPLYIEKVLGCY